MSNATWARDDRRRPKRLLLVAALAAAAIAAGCIRSRVHVTSDPPGAEVFWQGEPYGATPIVIPINYYWYYSVALEKPGYRRVEKVERFRTPPWFLMPLDLIMEILPIPIPDNRYRHYRLEPMPVESVPAPIVPPPVATPAL